MAFTEQSSDRATGRKCDDLVALNSKQGNRQLE
jgi:hypothetical protein